MPPSGGLDPSDISGEWTGEGWNRVTLQRIGKAQYSGTYADTFGEEPGKIELKWSRTERRYNGTWAEGKDRFGEISVRPVGEEIRGSWTTNQKSNIKPGTPELADLLWVRQGTIDQKPNDIEEKFEHLRKVWSKQRESIRTAEIRARYFLSGMQDIPRDEMEAFVAKLLPVIDEDPSPANVEAFVRKTCPVKKQSWRKAVLSTDGEHWREQLGDEVRYGPPRQPSVFSHLTLRSFWIVPSDKLAEIPGKMPDGRRVRFEQHSEDRTFSAVVDLASGHLLEMNTKTHSIAVNSEGHRYQGAFRKFSGITFPTVTMDIDYRDDKLYMIHLFVVEDARFNHPLEINPPD